MATKKQYFNLVPPMAGIDKKSSFRQQPPYATPDCQNVRPSGTIASRDRIGQRPGLVKAFYEQLGSGNPVRMLAEVDVVKNDGRTYWADYFNGSSLASDWSTASWVGTAPLILQTGQLVSTYTSNVGAVRTALSDFDTSSDYVIELFIVPYLGSFDGIYRIYFRMDNTTPDFSDAGTMAELTLTDSTYEGRLVNTSGGFGTEYTMSNGAITLPSYGIFKVIVSGDNVKAYWQGTEIEDQDVGAAAGARFGFGMETISANATAMISGFRIQYYQTAYSKITRKFLCASSNGTLYKDTWMGSLSAISSNLTIADDRLIHAQERLQKLYIADYEDPVAEGTDGVVSGTSFDSATYTDWSTLDMDTYSYVLVIASGGGAITADTYTISNIAAGNLTLGSAPGDGTAAVFSIERAPKIFDPADDSFTIWPATNGGQVPSGCYVIALYRDRLVLAKDHVWYMSRQGDPLDWDYSSADTDTQRAIAGSNEDAGLIGARVTALLSWHDDYLLFFADTQIWRLRGDPAYSGQLDNVSTTVGCVDKGAVCTTPEGAVIWLSNDGIYGMASVAASNPEKLSKTLPDDLKNIDPKRYTVTMKYDIINEGVHIYITPVDSAAGTHYWFEWETKTFWPDVFGNNNHQPTALIDYVGEDTTDSGVLLGGKDGYIRKHSDLAENDDQTAITSYIDYGPMQLASDYYEGILQEVIGKPSIGSGDVRAYVYVGDNNEAANEASIFMSGSFPLAGLNSKIRPKARGGSFKIRLSNDENRTWGMENLTCSKSQKGKQRSF